MKRHRDPDPVMDELWHSFGRAIGFTVAAFALLFGGGVLLIFIAAVFFGFIGG